MILVVIVVVGLAVEELHLAHHDGRHLACEQLGGVEAVALGIEHLGQARHLFEAAIDGDVDLGGHALVALGLDEEHAIGTFGTVEGGSVFQDRHALNVVHVQVGQQVVVVAVVKHLARILHVHHDVVDDDQRLGVGIERVDALDEHGVAQTGNAAAADGADVGTQLLGNERVDAQVRVVVKLVGNGTQRGRCRATVGFVKGLRVELAVGHARLVVGSEGDGVLLQVVAVDAHDDRTGVVGHADFVVAFLVGHGSDS